MNIAVLLLQNSDAKRATTYDRGWVERLMGHVGDYFVAQSGGREALQFHVFDWFVLPMTASEWDKALFGVGPLVRPMVERGLGVDLSPFTHFALVIDRADARLAAVSPDHPNYVHIAAQDMDAALLQHEFGHFLGANHANLDSPDGSIEYGDSYCVMGGEGSKFSFVHHPLDLTDTTGSVSTTLSDSGPGMVVPTLLACGWLQPAEHGIDLSAPLTSGAGPTATQISPLRGAPAPGHAVFAYAHGLADQPVTVEFRRRDLWDRAMPDPGERGVGWVVVHKVSTLDRGASSLLVAALPARVGASAYVHSAATGVTVTTVHPAGEWVTVALEAERSPSRYASVWEERDGTPWQARHGLSAADYQQTFTELATQGYRLVDVDVHRAHGQPRFSGIWRLESGPAWQARHGLTSEQYQQTFDEMTATGYRPLSVSGYDDGGQPRYAAVWSQAGGPSWRANHGVSAERYQHLIDTLPAEGFQPVRLNVATVAGQELFSVIWHKQDGPGWLARHGLTASEYQQLFTDLVGQGWRLRDVTGYGANGDDRYACLWERSPGPSWEARHGLTPFLHQQEFSTLTAAGRQLVRISGHNPSA